VDLIDPPSVSSVSGVSSAGGLGDNGQSILSSAGQSGGSVSVAGSVGTGSSQAQTVQHHPPGAGPTGPGTSASLNQYGRLVAGPSSSRGPSSTNMIPPGSKSPTDELPLRNQAMGGHSSPDSNYYAGEEMGMGNM
jgi:hypothetical protein